MKKGNTFSRYSRKNEALGEKESSILKRIWRIDEDMRTVTGVAIPASGCRELRWLFDSR
jgi:hypothetical protein